MITAVSNQIIPKQNPSKNKQVAMTGNFLKPPRATQEVIKNSTNLLESVIKKTRRLFHEAKDSLLQNKLHVFDKFDNLKEIHTFDFVAMYKGKYQKFLLKEFFNPKKGQIGHDGKIYSLKDGSLVSEQRLLTQKEKNWLNKKFRMNTNFMDVGWR